ncbi:MAG: PPOX class F420-dependent oxidoreductase [Acidimicrobiales bacterium]
MLSSPLPLFVEEFLAKANPAVIATVRQDGAPVSVATWYEWDAGRILVNMDASRRRLGHMRADPRVSITVLNPETWYHVSLRGRVVSLRDDEDLCDIDRLAVRYTGDRFEMRDGARVSAWIEVDSWHSWGVGEA